jgi:hypothetical protein
MVVTWCSDQGVAVSRRYSRKWLAGDVVDRAVVSAVAT